MFKFFVTFLVCVLIVACRINDESHTAQVTMIPYSVINSQLLFWQKKSSINELKHSLNTRSEEAYSVYLQSQSGDRQYLLDSVVGNQESLILPPFSDDEAKKWELAVTLPSWAVRLSPVVKTRLPARVESYQTLMQILIDLNENQEQSSLMPTFLQMKFNRLWFLFGEPAWIEIVTLQTTIRFESDEHHHIFLSLDEDLYRDNPLVVFSMKPNDVIPLN